MASKIEHPRQHSLTIAAAQHLHSAGHISGAQRDAISASARKKLDLHKAKKKKPPAVAPFGSLAPSGAGHYMSTVNPGMAGPPMMPPAAPGEEQP